MLALSEVSMESSELAQSIEYIANDIFVWIGFGTTIGLLAKAIMPGRDPGGAIATLAIGVGGTVIGCGVLSYFYESGRLVTPLSPLGAAVATAGAFIILIFYRLLGGYWFVEGDQRYGHIRPHHRRRRRRRYDYAAYDE